MGVIKIIAKRATRFAYITLLNVSGRFGKPPGSKLGFNMIRAIMIIR